MAKKREYYNITNLLETKAQYMVMLGKRANGKSYQTKLTCLTDAYKNKNKFVYLRRYIADIKQKDVTSYFDDMPIKKITNKRWSSVIAMYGYIYFCNRDEDGKIKEKEEIGRYCALNEAVRYKSQVFKDYYNIIYEEFITDEMYLYNEPTILQHFVSTVLRLNEGRVFLIGNTLSRVCPYFNEWCLEGVLKQKQGTIEIYHFHVDDGTGNDSIVNIAVEQCANTVNENTMFFGQASKQILTGEWDVKDLPKLPKKQYEYEKIYELVVEYQSFKFVVELLVEPVDGGILLFVYPLTSKRNIYRIITEKFSDKPNITSRLDLSRKPEKMIYDCLKMNKICYSDNLTGTDFMKCKQRLML
jgi:hypothetical protein